MKRVYRVHRVRKISVKEYNWLVAKGYTVIFAGGK